MRVSHEDLLQVAVALCRDVEAKKISDDDFIRLCSLLQLPTFAVRTLHHIPSFIVVFKKFAAYLPASSRRRVILLLMSSYIKKFITRRFHGDALVLKRPSFNINAYAEYEFKQKFRFHRSDIRRLRIALGIPDVVRTSVGCVYSGDTLLCLVLRRLSFPCRYIDLCESFGGSITSLSTAFNETIMFLRHRFRTILTLSRRRVSPARARLYCEAVHAAGGLLTSCFAFIDGTFRPACRPKYFQVVMFSGHKRQHGLKYLSLVSPDGIIQHLYGPIEARSHDAKLYDDSILSDLIKAVTPQSCIYGDDGFPMRNQLIVPYARKPNMPACETNFNHSMAIVRQCVEWSYRDVASIFRFIQHKENLKVFRQPIGTYYWVSVLLANCRTCLYGGISSNFFECEPLSLEDYLDTVIDYE